ncbi:hypothetical protein B6D60_06965 [candidate division KSB1 bacterium 4484_87]|nr:MAG: hypothetical protein B6D60_06965 [candidate division KSB1 bacterium 4484_87]
MPKNFYSHNISFRNGYHFILKSHFALTLSQNVVQEGNCWKNYELSRSGWDQTTFFSHLLFSKIFISLGNSSLIKQSIFVFARKQIYCVFKRITP